MDAATEGQPGGLRREVLATLRCAREVWRLVPIRRRWSLAAAALVMALASFCQVAIPLALGARRRPARPHPSRHRWLRPLPAPGLSRLLPRHLHRPAGPGHGDRQLVLEDGRIAEAGRYADLVRQNGPFAALVRSAGEEHPAGHGPLRLSA